MQPISSRRTLLGALLGAALSPVFPASAQQTPQILVKAARLFDVRAGQIRRNQGVLIRGERIVAVGDFAALEKRAGAGARLIDAGNFTVMPGLIDVHSHLLDARRPAISFYENNILRLLVRSPAEQTILGRKFAREMIDSGWTSARDLGDAVMASTSQRGDFELRQQIDDGRVVGPRLQVAGKKLTPEMGQHLHAVTPYAMELAPREYLLVTTPESARIAVRAAVDGGSDVIKVTVDDGNLTISPAAMRAIVLEAHRLGKRVAAHAHTAPAIKSALAGIPDSIEHANEATPADLRAMKRLGITLVPTDLQSEAVFELAKKGLPPVAEKRPEWDGYVEQQVKTSPPRLKNALQIGVKMAYGSDLAWVWPGRTRGGQATLALGAYAKAGMTPTQIARLATLDGARLMGWEDRVGSLEARKYADLIFVDGDPTQSIAALGRVGLVMKGGKVLKNALPLR